MGTTFSMVPAEQKIKLIDDSSTASSVTVEQGRVFNVVSGSITNGVKTLHQQKHQKVLMDYSYPDMGIILLNPTRLTTGVADITNQEVQTHLTITKEICLTQ